MEVSQLFSLQGRCALVTGGSRGIGRMIAEGLLSAGARVYISSRKSQACESAAHELSAFGACTALPADVSTLEGIESLLTAYRKHESTLDILVNNAGAAWGAPYEEFPESGWDKVVDLNLKTPFFLTREATPLLKASVQANDLLAKVIHITSIDGISVNPQETYSYAASKAGLIHLTRRMAIRLASDRITVNAIAPGAFASNMNKPARDYAQLVAQRIPLKRIGAPQDMAGAVIYLASQAGDYVTGSTMIVDGGVTWTRS
jgi:NAD(P)-dependent dehydrogenase (short-subunit alcohol dehydrogenase family)